jgi:uncharacterized protein
MNIKRVKKTILEFPCDFTIKVMGESSAKFEKKTTDMVKLYYPTLVDENVSINYSKKNNYCSLSFKIKAQSQEQLDMIYQRLSADPKVLMAL